MRRGIAIAAVAALGVLAIPTLAAAEETPSWVEIRSSEALISGWWAPIKVACILPEGQVCSGRIRMMAVVHRIGAGRALPLGRSRKVNLLGGEVRPVAIHLLGWVKESDRTNPREANLLYGGNSPREHVAVTQKIVRLIYGRSGQI